MVLMPFTRLDKFKGGGVTPPSSTLLTNIFAAYNAEINYTTSLSTSLFASYNGDSNTNDSFGTNHGTAVGGLTYSDGKINKAFQFNATNAYVIIPNTSNQFNLTSDFTISAWINVPNYSNTSFIFNNYQNGGTYGYGYNLVLSTNNTFQFEIRNGNTIGQYTTSTGITTNTWNNVVLVRTVGQNTKIYLNGTLISGSYTLGNSSITPTYQTTQICNIGSIYNGLAYSNAKQDSTNIWTRVLTQTEITELYNSGNGTQYSNTSFYKASPNDSVGTNHGTLMNGTTYAPGKIGNAFYFDGVNDYILLPQNSMRFSDSFSVSLWTYTTLNQGTLNGLFSDYYWGGANWGYFIALTTTNKVQVFFKGTSTDGGFNSTITLSNNQWNHIVVIWDKPNTTWKLYINNVLSDTYTNSTASSIGYAPGSNRTNIGAMNSSPAGIGSLFRGLIDGINVYNGAISESNISLLYNSGNGIQYPFT